MTRVYRSLLNKLVLLIVSFYSLAFNVYSQFTNDIQFERIYHGNSTSFGIVEDIQQDTTGFIWIGAKDGLFRYDGIQFTDYFYDPYDTNSLSNNVIREIFIDSRGKMWVGTENGLNLFLPERDQFQRFFNDPDNSESISGNNIRKLVEDQNNNLWITTFGGGVCQFDVETSKFTNITHIIKPSSIQYSVDARTIYIDSDKTIWIGTADKGALFFSLNNKQLYQLPIGKADGKHLNANDVRCIVEDSEGKIWIGTNGKGIVCYNKVDQSFVYYSSKKKGIYYINSDVIWNLYFDSRQNLWACTDGGGLLLLNRKNKSFKAYKSLTTDPKSISSNVVRVFYEDNAGNCWVGNFNAPVNYINTHRKKFHLLRDFDSFSDDRNQNKITSILYDSENNLWICTDGAGLYNYNLTKKRNECFKSKPADLKSIRNNKPLCIAEDQNGNLWIGLYEGGLSCYKRNEKHFKNYFPDGTAINPKSSQIWDVLVHENLVWIAGNQGIENYDLSTGTFNHNPFPTYPEPIYSAWSLMIDSNKRLWIGTINGLYTCDLANGTVHHILSDAKNINRLSENWVLNIFEDNKNHIWIGTNGGGLNLWKGGEDFDYFSIQDGLSGNVINGILSDNSGNLWVSTNGGITKFNFDSLQYINFDTEDGLQDNRFNINSCFTDDNGVLYFGGINGLTYFNPDEIVKNDNIPPVVITEIEFINKVNKTHDSKKLKKNNMIGRDEIHIYPGQLIFTIKFASLNFSHPHRNQYKYKLEGFDDDWNEVGNQNWATYTGLRPGKYTFKVLGSNDDQVWNKKGKQLRVIVHPPFYRSTWFVMLLIVLLILSVITIYRMRVKNIRIMNKRLSVLVAERTQELEIRNREIEKQNEEIIKQRDLATAQRDQIIRQNEELEKHRHRLEELIEERTQDLVEAKEKAEESDRLKTAFFENLSHQIRTPMNAIIGFVNLLTEKIDDKMSREYYLRIINESGHNMLRLIEDIIDFSRMQTGQLQPKYTECNASNLIRQLVSSTRDRASRENPSLSILTDIPQDDVTMFTDEKKLRQIFSKLLDNSMKFTEKGFIKIGIAKQEEKNITFFVADSGVGIEDQYIDKIFDRFFTVEEVDSPKDFRGSGLGLAFAKIITELLGGKIWVESKKLEGSTFYFSLPYIIVTLESKPIAKVDTKKFYWPSKTLLVAEDEESNYLLIEAILRDSGVTLIHVNDGVELLEKINDGIEFDLVLLDIKMPRMGGINAMKIIRESHAKVPVIVQTAYDQITHREQCKKYGCNEFLVKPLRKKELLELLDKYLG